MLTTGCRSQGKTNEEAEEPVQERSGGRSGSGEEQVSSGYNLDVEDRVHKIYWCWGLGCKIKRGVKDASPSGQHLTTVCRVLPTPVPADSSPSPGNAGKPRPGSLSPPAGIRRARLAQPSETGVGNA